MKLGTKHWSLQRLTAVALIPLSYWLIAFLQLCLQGNYFETIEWLASPINKIALCTWTIVVFYHAALGIQVVLEDYVSNSQKAKYAILLTNVAFASLALSGVVFLI